MPRKVKQAPRWARACHFCGAIIPLDAKRCPHCGRKPIGRTVIVY